VDFRCVEIAEEELGAVAFAVIIEDVIGKGCARLFHINSLQCLFKKVLKGIAMSFMFGRI
jgi:hypothetical protein